MKIFEITEASITTKPVEKNGKTYYKHDYSDQLFASEQMARDDERKKKPFISQKLKTFGGKAIVRGGKYQLIDGEEFVRTVIWEFPSFEQAILCHNSDEYQKSWNIAKNSTKRNLQIVEGLNIE